MPTLDHMAIFQRDRHAVSVHREIEREVKIQNVIDALKTLSDADQLPAKALAYAVALISELEQHLTSDVATRGLRK